MKNKLFTRVVIVLAALVALAPSQNANAGWILGYHSKNVTSADTAQRMYVAGGVLAGTGAILTVIGGFTYNIFLCVGGFNIFLMDSNDLTSSNYFEAKLKMDHPGLVAYPAEVSQLASAIQSEAAKLNLKENEAKEIVLAPANVKETLVFLPAELQNEILSDLTVSTLK